MSSNLQRCQCMMRVDILLGKYLVWICCVGGRAHVKIYYVGVDTVVEQ